MNLFLTTAAALVLTAGGLTLQASAQTAAKQAAAAGEIAVQGPYRVSVVAKGLDHPWSLAFLPDGRMLVTERAGRLRIIDKGRLSAPVAGVPAVFVRSQAGLFDVLPHPDFARNGLIYLSYATGEAQANAVRIARGRLEGGSLKDVRTIFTAAPLKNTPVHYGARMAWMPDGTLVMTTGDGFDFREKAQTLDNLFGKVIRITADGAIPRDNPFVGKSGARGEIWSFGHRNPQALLVDPATGQIWSNEHGPKGGDEINRIRKGANYGWPVATHGRDYSGASISPFKTYRGMVDPVVVWTPSIAPSGMTLYTGDLFPAWKGDLLVSALAAKELRRVDMQAGAPKGQQSLFRDLKLRLRDVRQGPDGAVYLLSDETDGKVLKVTPK